MIQFSLFKIYRQSILKVNMITMLLQTIQNPDDEGFSKKLVSKAWLDDNIDAEFMAKVNTWKGNTG